MEYYRGEVQNEDTGKIKKSKNLFLSLSLVLGVTFLLAEVFLWLSYRRLSLLLLILFLLAGCAVWAVLLCIF